MDFGTKSDLWPPWTKKNAFSLTSSTPVFSRSHSMPGSSVGQSSSQKEVLKERSLTKKKKLPVPYGPPCLPKYACAHTHHHHHHFNRYESQILGNLEALTAAGSGGHIAGSTGGPAHSVWPTMAGWVESSCRMLCDVTTPEMVPRPRRGPAPALARPPPRGVVEVESLVSILGI